MIDQGRNAQFAAPDAENVATWTQQLCEHGFCIIPEAVPRDLAARLNRDLDTTFSRTPFCEGGFYGRHTKRFGALLTRSQVIAGFIRHQLILAIAERLLGPWCDRFNLNLTQGIEIHPGAPAQYPHRDQDMWQGPKGETEYLINVIWPLSEFTAANGATLVWPDSHRPEMHDQPSSGDPVVAEMAPGAALVFLGSTLHGAGANRTGSTRRAIIVSYCLGWLKPFENQWLCYPPEIARHFEPELARMPRDNQHENARQSG